jgi:hypothetical protein
MSRDEWGGAVVPADSHASFSRLLTPYPQSQPNQRTNHPTDKQLPLYYFFSRFDVDVTTDPAPAPPGKAVGTRVVIGGNYTDWRSPSVAEGGVSIYGTFGTFFAPRTEPEPVFVFAGNLLNAAQTPATSNSAKPKFMAEVATHEVGHTCWLAHQGFNDGAGTAREQYRGHGVWAPIMGTAYDRPVTQWSKGE